MYNQPYNAPPQDQGNQGYYNNQPAYGQPPAHYEQPPQYYGNQQQAYGGPSYGQEQPPYASPPPPQQYNPSQPSYSAAPATTVNSLPDANATANNSLPVYQVPPTDPAAFAGNGQSTMSYDVNDNPFGAGKLPTVKAVTHEMRKARAMKIAELHFTDNWEREKGIPIADGSNDGNLDAETRKRRYFEKIVNEAMNEHNHPQLEMTSDLDKHEDRLGAGILNFFSFIKFLLFLTVVFATFQCATFGDYIRRHKPDFGYTGDTANDGKKSWIDQFMISQYNSSNDYKLWLAMNILCIILTFFSAPIYFWWIRWSESRRTFVDKDGVDMLVRFTNEGRIDVSIMYRSTLDVILRRILSAVVVVVMIGIQVIASYFITQNSVTNIGISFAISIIVATLNIIFSMLAERLTEFEMWNNFDSWKRYHTLKLMFFKLSNIITVFAAKRYDETGTTKCAYDIVGEQFITLLVIDIFAVNLQTIIMSMLFNKFSTRIADMSGSILGDQDNLPKFDIAVEYLQVIYRQYLVIMSMVVCPFSLFLSMVGYVVDYICKKFLLTKLSGVPRKIEASQKTFLTFVLGFIALCALLTPYAGSVFILSGLTRDKSSNLCHFP